MRRSWWGGVVALLATGVAAGAAVLASVGRVGAASEPVVVGVTQREYRFEGIPATLPAGDVRFEVANGGNAQHELQIVDGAGRRRGALPAQAPGASGTLQLQLEPGGYQARCLLPAGRKTHADLGMRQDFTVG